MTLVTEGLNTKKLWKEGACLPYGSGNFSDMPIVRVA
jgi:hypothetical protein